MIFIVPKQTFFVEIWISLLEKSFPTYVLMENSIAVLIK